MVLMCCTARLVATREEEQAVSTAMEGPERPMWKLMRPGATLQTGKGVKEPEVRMVRGMERAARLAGMMRT